MSKVSVPQVGLFLALLLAPLIGGQVSVEPQPAAGFLSGLFAGELPFAAHALLAILVLAASAALLLGRRVIQVPSYWATGFLALLLFCIGFSVGLSRFRYTSVQTTLEWVSYAAAFYLALGCAGRRRGAFAAVGAVALGTVLLALRALAEYGETRSPMFAGWNNPNALAGILAVGFFCCMGLAVSLKDRFLVPWLGAVAIGLATVLTQSKGGLLVLGGASLIFLVFVLAWGRDRAKTGFLRGLSAIVVVAVLVGAMQARQSAPAEGGAPSTAPLGRVVAAQETQAQSFTFRKLLYQTAIDLTQKHPMGTGPGTFQYYSARPGRVTSTVYAHNTTLQLASESSWLAATAFLGFVLVWLAQVFRGARSTEGEVGLLRAGVATAVLAAGAHSLVESSFSYYGLGLVVFALAGIALLLSADAVAPEQTPKELRIPLAAFCVLISVAFVAFVAGEYGKSRLAHALVSRDPAAAKLAAEAGQRFSGGDGQFWFLKARVAATPEEALQDMQRAAQLYPQPRILRMLGRMFVEQGKPGNASAVYREALDWDPNNLPALRALTDLEADQGRHEEARRLARRTVDVEKGTYYTVRSIAELVPTETYYARLVLARLGKREDRPPLLKEALQGYERYMAITVPQILRFAEAGIDGYAGESLQDALDKVEEAREAAILLGQSDEAESKRYLDLLDKVADSLEEARAGLQ